MKLLITLTDKTRINAEPEPLSRADVRTREEVIAYANCAMVTALSCGKEVVSCTMKYQSNRSPLCYHVAIVVKETGS